MTFKNWYAWLKQLQWSRKWFVILVLIRPIIDLFHGLKGVSPFLSPLYIVGVATPFLIIASSLSGKLKEKKSLEPDKLFFGFGILVFLNSALMLPLYFSLDVMGEVIKYISPIMLFFYLRRFINSYKDFEGILQTFLISCTVPYLMIFYEFFFNPIAFEYLAEGRGGAMRLQGGYADIMSYAIYILCGFISASYFFIKAAATEKPYIKTGIVFMAAILGLVAIKQVSSWGVFLCSLIIFSYFFSKKKQGFIFVILIATVIATVFAPEIYNTQINPLIEKEIAVAAGEKDVNYAFNGRMTRWNNYFSIWDEMPLYSKIFGVSTSGFDEVPVMTGLGMHSDYIRILFMTGVMGIIIYLLFFLSLMFKYPKLQTKDRYLLLASVVVVLLYSISTLPTLYMPMMYLILSTYAYYSLPLQYIYPKVLNEKAV